MRIIRIMSLAGTLFACASTAPPPNEKMQESSGAIRAAEEVGAPKVPQAALHLQLAKEQTGRAQMLLAKGDRSAAEGMLMRAQADAELAVALSREETSRTEAEQAVEQVRQLRQINP
jgi:regulator of protease activity HflC (stomatin/prohibitin superfamily)